ncbi:HD-GYP domain-containing protein [Paenibacillus sp. D51F]
MGLSGQEIPLAGRIAAITDTYSALTSDRPYSKAVSHETAIAIMEKDAEQFDPKILEVFIQMPDVRLPNRMVGQCRSKIQKKLKGAKNNEKSSYRICSTCAWKYDSIESNKRICGIKRGYYST